MTTGSFSDYARHIGASPAYVSKLKAKGRLVTREVDGKEMVDFELSDRLVRNTADLSKLRNGENAQRDRPPSAPLAPLADVGRADVLFRQAQTQERVYNAKLAELDYRERVGELVRLDEVKAEQSRLLASIREVFLQMPSRVTPLLAAASGPADIEAVLRKEIAAALQMIAEDG